MIGLKNPSVALGDHLCGEVWFNELRISGIDSKGGWATVGSIDGNLADFANFSASGRYSTIGFGSIDQSPNQRSRDELVQYDIVSNFNLGQLIPKKWGIEIPLNFSSGETILTPEYDPFYQDLKLVFITIISLFIPKRMGHYLLLKLLKIEDNGSFNIRNII